MSHTVNKCRLCGLFNFLHSLCILLVILLFNVILTHCAEVLSSASKYKKAVVHLIEKNVCVR